LQNIVDSLPLYEINKDIATTIKQDKVSERVKIASLQKSLRIYIERNKKVCLILFLLLKRLRR